MDPFSILSFATGLTSAYLGGQSKKKAAAEAAAEAKRLRDWHELQARETKRSLGREIESMRTIRDLDLPAYQQSARIAEVQRARGYEAAMRSKMQQIGRLSTSYRDAVFGQSLPTYLGRESQKLQRHAEMTQGIFGAASQMQSQVNAMLESGGAQYGTMMKTSQMMEYESGDPLGQVLGAVAQGASLMASQNAAEKSQQEAMAGAFGLEAWGRHVKGGGDLASFKMKYKGGFSGIPDFLYGK